ILALARAAESFGKGQRTPEEFRPRGADEVRRAGAAFIQMRERIEKQIEQRTAMLSGVSHDLRTILTRFKLQLAIVGDAPEFEGLTHDVDEMQSMLEGYLSFARSEAEEDVGTLDLEKLFGKIEQEARLRDRCLSTEIAGNPVVKVRPKAFSRLIINLSSNALRYADTIEIKAKHDEKWLTIMVEDDGPGIPADAREDVFKPFYRLDQARNLNESGTGLGLSIARDIARSHGGDISLSDSPLGGLRATIRIPA
ncbi:MAG TPA: ATP-binding protein, partial [Pararhizobium sp.]|nr:ATP-binding protein [Pararhizobium sp.]